MYNKKATYTQNLINLMKEKNITCKVVGRAERRNVALFYYESCNIKNKYS